jgi:uncharacterized membrane protein
MRKNFLTGVAILLPIALTFWIIGFLVHLLTNPFLDITKALFSPYLPHHFPILLFSRILILLFLAAITILTGFLAEYFFLKQLFRLSDYLLQRIPLINRIYIAVQNVIHTFLNRDKSSYTKVALVPFPHDKAYCLGFVTTPKIPEGSDPQFLDKVSLCVVGSPNPMMGFMILYDKSKVILLDMSVEQALKYIVSCGSVAVTFRPWSSKEIRDVE